MYKKISWIVVEWKKLWRQLSFPTANVKFKDENLEPWTYKINIVLNDTKYSWVWAYLDWSETFEAHIFDFNLDIYGKEMDVYILDKIRENRKFLSLDDLKEQIGKDVIFARETTDIVLTFWTFDIFHAWHENFLREANFWWDKVITIISTDENVLKFKWTYPDNNEEKRLETIVDSHLVTNAFIGKWDNPMLWLELYNPKVVCLWYDQIWFSNLLESYVKENNLDIKILRLNPYKEDIYKSSILKKLK